jgi:hypothetical protein
MISLIDKTYQYIHDLNENDTNKLLENIIDFYSFNLDIKKEWLLQLITFNYFDYGIRDEIIEKDIKIELIKTYILNNSTEKIGCIYELYRDAKFCHSNEISTFLTELGIKKMFHTHFVDVEKMENILFSIIQSGIIIDYAFLIIIIDIMYDLRIHKEIYEIFIDPKIIEEYDGKGNVHEIEIQLKNIRRKRKYASKKAQKKELFEDLILDVNKINSEIDQPTTLIEVLNGKTPLYIKNLLQSFLNHLIEVKGRAEVLKIFKDYFHILFESNLNGLLTEESFVKENDVNEDFAGKYCGNYMKYYSTRIKTLVGI